MSVVDEVGLAQQLLGAEQSHVQARIADNRTNDNASRAEHPSLLVGMIEDAEGRPMTPCHANKQGRRYRYYVTRPDTCGRRAETGWRLPAGEIETLVTARIAAWLRDAAAIAGIGTALPAASLPALLTQCERLATTIEVDRKAATRALLVDLQARVRVADTGVTISLTPAHLIAMATATPAPTDLTDRITIEASVTLVRRGHELRLVHRPQDHTQPAAPDVKLIGLIAKAEAAHRELMTNDAVATNRKPHLLRLARLRYLAPDITAAILEGHQPVQLSARRLLRADAIPLCWKEQRASLGFG